MRKWDIIRAFSEKERSTFTYREVEMIFPNSSSISLQKHLASLVKERLLIRLIKGVYCMVPANSDPPKKRLDWRLVAGGLSRQKQSYIGYHSAMEIHALTNSELPEKYIVSPYPRSVALIHVGGVPFRYVNHKYRRYFGYEKVRRGLKEPVLVSDIDKTIVDICTKPGLSGGVVEVANAIKLSEKRTDLERLFYYMSKNDNHSARKRYLYLSELLGLKWTKMHDKTLAQSGKGLSLLDSSRPALGEIDKKFGLRINLEDELIEEIKALAQNS